MAGLETFLFNFFDELRRADRARAPPDEREVERHGGVPGRADRGPGAACTPGAVRRGRVRAADRVRERSQPAVDALGGPGPRGDHSDGTGRRALAASAPAE